MNRQKIVIRRILAVLAFIAISNTPYISLIYMAFVEGEGLKSGSSIHYSSNNPDGFSVNGHDLEMVKGFFNTYRLTHPQDSVLYRNFKMSLWKFWRWHWYLIDPAYKLPYAPRPSDAGEVQRVEPEEGGRLIYRPAGDGSKGLIPYMVPDEVRFQQLVDSTNSRLIHTEPKR